MTYTEFAKKLIVYIYQINLLINNINWMFDTIQHYSLVLYNTIPANSHDESKFRCRWNIEVSMFPCLTCHANLISLFYAVFMCILLCPLENVKFLLVSFLQTVTRLPSNLRLTTRSCKCTYLWSCDKGGSHNMKSAIEKNQCCKQTPLLNLL